MELGKQKKALREELLARIDAFPADYLEESDGAILTNILSHPAYERAERLMVYFSVGKEVSTLPVIAHALAFGKRVALPRCAGGGKMNALFVDPDGLSGLVPSRFGIPEPGEGEIADPASFDLILVPALAFSRDGTRLGRGGGYYDRYLARAGGFTMGLCRGKLFYGALPGESHDIRVDCVVTEAGAFAAGRSEK